MNSRQQKINELLQAEFEENSQAMELLGLERAGYLCSSIQKLQKRLAEAEANLGRIREIAGTTDNPANTEKVLVSAMQPASVGVGLEWGTEPPLWVKSSDSAAKRSAAVTRLRKMVISAISAGTEEGFEREDVVHEFWQARQKSQCSQDAYDRFNQLNREIFNIEEAAEETPQTVLLSQKLLSSWALRQTFDGDSLLVELSMHPATQVLVPAEDPDNEKAVPEVAAIARTILEDALTRVLAADFGLHASSAWSAMDHLRHSLATDPERECWPKDFATQPLQELLKSLENLAATAL